MEGGEGKTTVKFSRWSKGKGQKEMRKSAISDSRSIVYRLPTWTTQPDIFDPLNIFPLEINITLSIAPTRCSRSPPVTIPITFQHLSNPPPHWVEPTVRDFLDY